MLWSDFDDTLDDSNSNRISKMLSGTILRSQLYGHAKDQAQILEKGVIQSERRAEAIVACVYPRAPHSDVAEVYADFIASINVRR